MMRAFGNRGRTGLATLAVLVALLLAAGGSILSGRRDALAQPPDPGGAARPVRVTGTLVALVPGVPGALAEVALPDAAVTLRDRSGQDVGKAATQLDGKFHVLAPGPGGYEICWEAIGRRGCSAKVEVGDATAYVGRVAVRAEGPLLHGRVLTGDDRPCWVSDPFFGLDVSTAVGLRDLRGNEVIRPVRANTRGEFVLAAPAAGRYLVHAQCEKSGVEARAAVGNATVRRDLRLPNRAPRIASLSAGDGTRGLTRAAPGAALQMTASVRDPDGDTIEYLWRSNDGSGLPGAVGSPVLAQAMPQQPGLHSVYLLARDGKGGYAFKRLDIEVSNPTIRVSGRVIDEGTKAPVAKATVQLGPTTVATNEQGWFSVAGTPDPSDRYVLNIRHPDYALLSRIHDRSASGNTYELIRAQVSSHPADSAIDLTDRESSGPCGSPGGRRQPRISGPVTRPTVIDEPDLPPRRGSRARIDIEKLTEPRPCRHVGAQVTIPAGALVDAGGQAATGPVRVALATLDPSRRALPGDYQAIDRRGERTEMLSFGAVSVDLRDAAGNRLDLKPGASAEVRVPVPQRQRAAAAQSIPMWSYDEASGFWVEEGQAALQQTAAGPMYVGRTRHFSTLNMDVAGNDPAAATCVRVEVDASLSAWSNLVLRAYVSYNGNALQVKETPLDSAQYHAIYRIPFGTAFPPNTLRLELRGTFGGQPALLLDNIIDTDARPKMTGTNLWPPYPYTECGVPIRLAADPIAMPPYGDLDATGRPAFLTGPYGQYLPADAEQVATDYYNAIDPATPPAKDQLGKWWTANGFGADGSGGRRAAYLNHGDLGLGRDMHCLKTAASGAATSDSLACYVTNYGLPDQNLGNADAAATRDPAKRAATVTMEYNGTEPDPAKRVQFYVFGGGDASSGRIKFADLDGFGPKPVPHLCLVCHGGDFDNAGAAPSNKAIHARFREFDLPSFRYSGGRSWDHAPAPNTLLPAELASLAALNQMVRDIAPTPSPIRSLIDNWYPSGSFGAVAPVKPAVPAGWSGSAANVAGYHDVYGKSCRTCHLARDENAGFPPLTFSALSNFTGTSYTVCGVPPPPKERVMPNAAVTYKNFWANAPGVLQYEALTATAANTCKN